jgi:hypothetical protein
LYSSLVKNDGLVGRPLQKSDVKFGTSSASPISATAHFAPRRDDGAASQSATATAIASRA